jgi:hypothetical protein
MRALLLLLRADEERDVAAIVLPARVCVCLARVCVTRQQVAKEIWEVAAGSVKKIDVDIATYAAALPQ